MNEWIKRENGKGAIDRAGQFLMEWWKDPSNDMPMEQWSPPFACAYTERRAKRTCRATPKKIFFDYE
jgi:hypothetical protein